VNVQVTGSAHWNASPRDDLQLAGDPAVRIEGKVSRDLLQWSEFHGEVDSRWRGNVFWYKVPLTAGLEQVLKGSNLAGKPD
jgi:hypothetical protein